MTGPVGWGGDGAATAAPAEVPVELPPRFRSGLSERGIDLEEEAGRGAMSVVYRATDRRDSRPVAVKVLRPGPGEEYDSDRFLREIQLAAGLRHPHILPVYDSGAVDGTLFYVMPYVAGETLRQRLSRTGRLPIANALHIARDVAGALDYAHAHGVVHRDIKPENILLEAGHAVVADFGVALVVSQVAHKAAADQAPADGRLTRVGVVVGTPAYMSPEQASGDGRIDGRSDVYSLGCVLYEMLTGEPPFIGPTSQGTIARRFQGPPVPVRARRPEVPAAVALATEKALAIEPADRFATAADFRAALGTAGGRGIAGLRAATVGRRGFTLAVGSLALAAVALAASRGTPGHRARLNPLRVAVAALSNETGDTTLAPLGSMVASWITDRLSRTPGVRVVTSAIVMPAQHDQHFAESDVDDPTRLHRLATETRAGTLVSGSYYRGIQGGVEFHVEITDANSGRLLRAIGPITACGAPARTAGQLSAVVAAAVDTLIADPGFPTR
jgi:eukaryotic-like serine/threonine-protein kinase